MKNKTLTIINGRENRGQLQLSVGLKVVGCVRGSQKPRPRLVHASTARGIIMAALAGMTALPMQAMPVFAESTEIRNTTEDGSSFVGDWSCGTSGSKTMTINADGTYTAKNGDKEESGKWKMQNGDLMLDNGTTDATRCTLDEDMINAYVDGSVSVYRKGGVIKQTEKESDEEEEKIDENALMDGLADDEDGKSTDETVEAKKEDIVGDWLKKITQLLMQCS